MVRYSQGVNPGSSGDASIITQVPNSSITIWAIWAMWANYFFQKPEKVGLNNYLLMCYKIFKKNHFFEYFSQKNAQKRPIFAFLAILRVFEGWKNG